jgi:hypothetical protein
MAAISSGMESAGSRETSMIVPYGNTSIREALQRRIFRLRRPHWAGPAEMRSHWRGSWGPAMPVQPGQEIEFDQRRDGWIYIFKDETATRFWFTVTLDEIVDHGAREWLWHDDWKSRAPYIWAGDHRGTTALQWDHC